VLETVLRLAHPIIPFITEELWQRTAPLAQRYGARGNQSLEGEALNEAVAESRFSISTQPYPQADLNKLDPASEAWVDRLKGLIEACRALRSEMGLQPGTRVPLLLEGAANELADFGPYLKALARLESVEVVEMLPADSPAPWSVPCESCSRSRSTARPS
jgi:valyl-tRNA synthetase